MIADQIRQRRLQMGLTQMELASKAKLSLATLQNIETGKANPAVKTLESVLSCLGLRLCIQLREPDWEALIVLGVPLMSTMPEADLKPDRLYLLRNLAPLSDINLNKLSPREKQALAAFLWALKDHYPSVWVEIRPELKSWYSSQSFTGSHIKLRRISLSKLSRYL